jgi:hypothetical protein
MYIQKSLSIINVTVITRQCSEYMNIFQGLFSTIVNQPYNKK